MTKKRSRITGLIFLTILFLITHDAQANVIIPSIYLILGPAMALLFIPVVLIEAGIFKLMFPKLKYRVLLKANAKANLFSAVWGVPISWLAFVGIEFLTNSSATFNTIVYLGIPFFCLSAWLESKVMVKELLSHQDHKSLKRATWLANMASYGFLYALAMILWKSIH